MSQSPHIDRGTGPAAQIRAILFDKRWSGALRYLISGGITYVVYAAIILGGEWLDLSRTAQTVHATIAYLVSGVVNYLLHYHFTYRSSNNHTQTALGFWAVVALGAGLLALIVYLLHGRLAPDMLLIVKLAYSIAWPVVSALLLTFIVFKPKQGPPSS